MPDRYTINGRFGTQRMTGVQRVGACMLHALDGLQDLPGTWRLLSAPGEKWPRLKHVRLDERPSMLGRGHGWEQTVVASAAARGACVINLAGSGPWFGGPQVSWLHDAAVFDHPKAYRAAFVHWYRALFHHRARRGDLLVTPSAHAAERLSHHLGVPRSRLHVLHHGADHLDRVKPDPAQARQWGLDQGAYWLAIASDNPTKNIASLIEAVRRLPANRRLPLVLVGAGNPRVFAAAPDASDGVIRVGAIDDAALKGLLIGARALVMPSIVEGFGLPAVEAMRCGCAVVAANASALPEVCADAALYVDPHSVDTIVEALDALAQDDRLLARLQAAGLAHTAPMTWARSAGTFVHWLRDRFA